MALSNDKMLTKLKPKANCSQSQSDDEEVCLKWNSHHSNMKTTFPSLLEMERYVDVTLSSEGQTIRCHRLILSSCSTFFDGILSGITPPQHPVIFLNGIPFKILKTLIDFMYTGEAYVENEKIQDMLDVAEILKVKGLMKQIPSQKSVNQKVSKPPASPSTPTAPAKPAETFRSVSPLKVSLTKEQAASIHTFDPLRLLEPSFYEGSAQTGSHKNLLPMRPSYYHKSMVPNNVIPKKKYKRKSTYRELSPPAVVIPRGTRSRPIINPPKLYQTEVRRPHTELKPIHLQLHVDEAKCTQPAAVAGKPKSQILPSMLEPTFDISKVKSEVSAMDIEEAAAKVDPLAEIRPVIAPDAQMATITAAADVKEDDSSGRINIKLEIIDDDSDEVNVTEIYNEQDPLSETSNEPRN